LSTLIDGRGPVTLILDTGADRIMVSPAALARLGIAMPGAARTRLRGVTGSSSDARAGFVTLAPE
jgi:hypothetical protein